ncbi:MAG: diaminopimelate epimerase [Muribaculaceae bacterium]|nr:diaminopimelate epimerase [Muribaculaceae bacterium]
MHGAGNDYIYIDALTEVPDNLPLLSRQISDRHFGVGSDGLVVILPSERADFRMRMFNADGSEAEMCGNASRCIGKFVFEKGLTEKTEVTLETLAGIRTLHLHVSDGEVKEVTVDMGAPELVPELIPVKSASSLSKISEKEIINGIEYEITAVGMGNPHAIVFVPALFDRLVLGEGPKMEVAEIFPNKANIEFIKIIDLHHVEMRVWERGSGETMACGTGACASVVAGVLNGLTDREVYVSLPGVTLKIHWDERDNHVYLTGSAEFVADGVFYPYSPKEAKEENKKAE